MQVGELFAKLGLDDSKFNSGMDNAKAKGEQTASAIGSGFRSALNIARGMVIFEVIQAGFNMITGAIENTIGASFEFAKSMEINNLGIAGILTSMTQVDGRATTWNESLAVSKDIMSKLNDEALRTAATSEELVTAYRALLGPGLAAQMTMDDILKLTVVGTNAVKSLGLEGTQVVQELRDLVQGGITSASSLARALQISDADITKHKALGDLYEFLMTRLKGFEQSSSEYGKTTKGVMDQIQEAISRIGSAGLATVFDAAKGVLSDISDQLVTMNIETGKMEINPNIVATLQNISVSVVGIITNLRNFAPTAISTVGSAFSLVYNNANILKAGIVGLIAAWSSYKVITLGAQLITLAMTAATAFHTGTVALATVGTSAFTIANLAATVSMVAGIAATEGLAAAFTALTVAMNLNPVVAIISLVVLAIGALVGAVYYVYQDWNSFKSSAITLWNNIVDVISNNVLAITVALGPLGLVIAVIATYWEDGVNLIMGLWADFTNWLAPIVATVVSIIDSVSIAWPRFVDAAQLGCQGFMNALADLANRFAPDWAKSLYSTIVNLGSALYQKTIEIGNKIRAALSISVGSGSDNTAQEHRSPGEGYEEISTVPVVTALPLDTDGGKEKKAKKSGKSDEEKEYEKLQKAAERASESIEKEWTQLTNTKLEQLDKWKADELKTLNESQSVNDNYQRDLGRLEEIYAEKKKKILYEQQKDTNSIWDNALSGANKYQDRLNEIGMGEGTKQVFEIKSNAEEELTKIKNAARDTEQAFVQLSNESKLQTIQAMTEAKVAFTVTKDGMIIDAKDLASQVKSGAADMSNTQINLAQDTANKTAIIHTETTEKLKNIDSSYIDWKKALDIAYNNGELTTYAQLLTNKEALHQQELTGEQEMLDTYYEAWKETHRTSMSYMAELTSGIGSSFKDFFSDAISGASSVSDAWSDLGQSISKVISNMIAEWISAQIQMAAMNLFSSIFKISLFSNGGSVSGGNIGSMVGGFASGGYTGNSGSRTKDHIPAMLTAGEYVLDSDTVSAIGIDKLNALNSGNLLGFSTGGQVLDPSLYSTKGSNATKYSIDTTTNSKVQPIQPQISLHAWDGKSVDGWLNNGGAKKIARAINSAMGNGYDPAY